MIDPAKLRLPIHESHQPGRGEAIIAVAALVGGYERPLEFFQDSGAAYGLNPAYPEVNRRLQESIHELETAPDEEKVSLWRAYLEGASDLGANLNSDPMMAGDLQLQLLERRTEGMLDAADTGDLDRTIEAMLDALPCLGHHDDAR